MMNLFNFKKTIVVAGTLAAAFFAQQASAWEDPYLYCSQQEKNSWKWATTNNQPFNDTLEIGYKEGNYLRLVGHYPSGYYPETLPFDLKGIFIIDGKMRDEGQAKAVCEELQKFCPATSQGYEEIKKFDQIYLGAARYSTSAAHQVGVYFKYDPSNSSEGNSILLCPSWQYEKGRLDLSCGRIYGPQYQNEKALYVRDERSAGLGICKGT